MASKAFKVMSVQKPHDTILACLMCTPEDPMVILDAGEVVSL